MTLKFPWFRRHGIFFIPASFAGFAIFIGGLVYSVYTFLEIDSRSHSASDTLMNFFFNLLIIFLIYSIIALLTSLQKDASKTH